MRSLWRWWIDAWRQVVCEMLHDPRNNYYREYQITEYSTGLKVSIPMVHECGECGRNLLD